MYHLRTTRGKDDGEMQVAVIWSPMLYLLDTPSILGPYLGRSKIESRRRSHWSLPRECTILHIQVRAGMGFPRDFPRAEPEGNPEENPFLPELGCVV